MSFLCSPLWSFIKDLVSLSIPILVVIFGWLINRSIQRRNRIEERSSALATQWANDFALLGKNINDIATSVLFAYIKTQYLEQYDALYPEREIQLQGQYEKMKVDNIEWKISLAQRGYEMERFIGLMPNYGSALHKSFEILKNTVEAWQKNNGGNIDKFRAAQLDFNRLTRSAHEELLQLDDH